MRELSDSAAAHSVGAHLHGNATLAAVNRSFDDAIQVPVDANTVPLTVDQHIKMEDNEVVHQEAAEIYQQGLQPQFLPIKSGNEMVPLGRRSRQAEGTILSAQVRKERQLLSSAGKPQQEAQRRGRRIARKGKKTNGIETSVRLSGSRMRDGHKIL